MCTKKNKLYRQSKQQKWSPPATERVARHSSLKREYAKVLNIYIIGTFFTPLN